MGKSPPPTQNLDDESNPNRIRSWQTHGALLLAALGLWLAIVLAYAGASWALALLRLILDGGCLLLWLAAGTGFGIWLLQFFEPPADPLHYITATALGLGLLSLLTLVLGLVGLLNQISSIALIVVGLVALAAHFARSKKVFESLKQWRSIPAGSRWFLLLAIPPMAMMSVAAMLPPYLLWTPDEPHGYDAVEYHLQVPREWYEAGQIAPLHHNVFSYLPFNVEMHYLLAMHLRGGPWAGMYLAQFMHTAFIVLSVLAAGAIAGRLSKERIAPVVAILTTAGIPMLAQLGAIAYVEGGFLFFGVLSIGWTLIAMREPENRVRRFALAGAMAGFACGAKLTALPEILVAVPAITFAMFTARKDWRSIPISRRLLMPAVFGLAGLLTFAPWLIRTAKWAGNPLFPEVPQLGRGPFTEAQAQRWKHSLEPREDQRSVPGRLKAGWDQIIGNWQYGFVLVPGALVAFTLSRRDPSGQFLGALFFLLCLFWLAFTHLQSRFFVLAVPICALLLALAPRKMFPVAIAQALINVIALHLALLQHHWTQAAELLGNEVLIPRAQWGLTPPALANVPPNASIALIGDARAFLYQIPMTNLKYRTVFDVDLSTSRSFLDAWAGPPVAGQLLVIDPTELKRFEKTYQPFPPVPAEITAHGETYMIPRN